MKENIVDVNFTEVNNSSDKKYSTIEEISEILSIPVSTIIFWCNKFNYMLNIQSIGMYQIFSENDIKNLKTIKKLNIEDNMNVNEIKDYLSQNKGVIIQKKEIEVPEVSLLTVIAKILTSQNEKIETLLDAYDKMLNLNQQIMKNQENFINRIGESQKEISIDIENKTSEIIESQEQQKFEMLDRDKLHEEEVKSLKEEISKLNETVADKINSMEQEVTKNILDREEVMKQHMENKKNYQQLLQVVESQQEKKSFLSKIFGK